MWAMQVVMLGHSAGAHLCAMALLRRLPAVRAQLPPGEPGSWADSRMPAAFIGSSHANLEQRLPAAVLAIVHA